MAHDRVDRTAGRVLARLARVVELGLAPLELSLPQYRVLAFLAAGEAGSSAMAEKLAVSPPSITAVVDGLVAKGLVERKADPADRRRLPLSLTDRGRTALTEADNSVHERLERILEQVEPDRAAAAGSSVGTWAEGLDLLRSTTASRAARA
jgi:long-chain acyl-CoA synthetase